LTEPVVVDTQWVRDHLGDSSIVLVDVRPPHFYAQGHLPGAVNLPVILLSRADGGPPEAVALGAHLGEIGIARETHVVAYDDGASPSAAFFFWTLSYYRHPAVSVLDGGVTKWRRDGEELIYLSISPAAATYDVGDPDPEVLVRFEEVRQSLGSPDTVLVDVRSPAEYLGLRRTAARNGHIPGAINIDWTNNLERSSDGVRRLMSDDALRSLYETAGVTPDKRIILHCQSGGRSSETFLVLKKLGYPDVANYPGGWQEWGNRGDTPVEEF